MVFEDQEVSFNFKQIFSPLTTKKAILIIVVLGFIVFFNSLFNGFVWDDEKQIVVSPSSHSLSSIPTIFTIGQVNVFYRPIFLSYLTVINTLFQGNVFFFHFFQVGMHIINVIIIFLVLKKLLNEGIALIISLTFLVHPMNVEAVVYMSAVSDVMVFLIGIIALKILMKNKLTTFHFIFAGFLILLSLLTKESGILWSIILVTYLFLFKKIKQWYTALLFALPISVYAFMRFVLAQTGMSKVNYVPIDHLSFAQRLITLPKILFFYFHTFLYPAQLAIAQYWVVKSINFNDFLLPLLFDILFLGILASGGIYIYRWHKREFRSYFFFFIWFVISLSMYLQIFPLYMTVAERWFYIPMGGLLGMLSIVAQTIKLKPTIQFWSVFFAIMIILSLSVRTIVRNANWTDALTLYNHDIKINKDSFDLQANLAYELEQSGRFDDAIKYAQQAIKLEPDNAAAWAIIGTTYLQQGQLKPGIIYSRKTLDYDGGNYSAFIILPMRTSCSIIHNLQEVMHNGD